MHRVEVLWFIGIWGRFVRLLQRGQLQRYILYTLLALGILVILNATGGLK